MKFHPREGDRPRAEIMKMADNAIAKFGGPKYAEVYFKFTCPECGQRCTFQEPNKLFETGECFECLAERPVTHGGFALHFKISDQSFAAQQGDQ